MSICLMHWGEKTMSSEITEDMLAVLDQSSSQLGYIECVEVSHQNWDEVLRFVINSNFAFTVQHGDGIDYEYKETPITVNRNSDNDSLDQALTFFVGDSGSVLPDLMDLVFQDDERISPKVAYRVYLLSNLNKPFFMKKGLDLDQVIRDSKEKSSRCEVTAQGLNDNGNGPLYTASRYPSLMGFYL